MTHYVYELYGTDGPLYVGCSSIIGTRIQQHSVKDWWPEVVRIEVTAYPTVEVGRQAEAERLHALNPVHNKAGTLNFDRLSAWDGRRRAAARRHAAGESCLTACPICAEQRRAYFEARKLEAAESATQPANPS